MDRTNNGSWGQVRIDVPFEEEVQNLLVFDNNFEPGTNFTSDDPQPEYLTGMVYSDDGWLDKKIFLANRDEFNTVYFEYTFEGATIATIGLGLLVTAQAMLTLI